MGSSRLSGPKSYRNIVFCNEVTKRCSQGPKRGDHSGDREEGKSSGELCLGFWCLDFCDCLLSPNATKAQTLRLETSKEGKPVLSRGCSGAVGKCHFIFWALQSCITGLDEDEHEMLSKLDMDEALQSKASIQNPSLVHLCVNHLRNFHRSVYIWFPHQLDALKG